jgi:hypothetical protein
VDADSLKFAAGLGWIRSLRNNFIAMDSFERKRNMKHDVDDGGGTAVMDRTGTGRKTSPAGGPVDKQEMQRKMEAAGTPGPAHKALEALVGSWKAEVKCWHDPSGAAQVSQGTAKTRWILNGRFLEEEFHGEMMGKPFTGKSLMGYDNTKQKYNMVWISDMQTSTFTSEGRGEDGNKTITLEGRADCPATGQRDVLMKSVFRVLGPDKHIFEIYDGSKGNAKTMEITYTRS